MRLEIIETSEEVQEIYSYDGMGIPETKNALFDFLYPSGIPQRLRKLSICQYGGDNIPAWADECNGKIYFNGNGEING